MRVHEWMPRKIRTKSSGCQRRLLCCFVSWCEKPSPTGQPMPSCSSGSLCMRWAPLRVYTPSGAHALALWSLTALSCLGSPDGEQLEAEAVEGQHQGPSGDISLGVGCMVSHIVRISHLLAVWFQENALTFPVWGEITNNITQVVPGHPRPKKRGLNSMALGQSPPRDSLHWCQFYWGRILLCSSDISLLRAGTTGVCPTLVRLMLLPGCPSLWQDVLTWRLFCACVPWFAASWSFPLQLSRRYLITPSSSHDKLWSLFFPVFLPLFEKQSHWRVFLALLHMVFSISLNQILKSIRTFLIFHCQLYRDYPFPRPWPWPSPHPPEFLIINPLASSVPLQTIMHCYQRTLPNNPSLLRNSHKASLACLMKANFVSFLLCGNKLVTYLSAAWPSK